MARAQPSQAPAGLASPGPCGTPPPPAGRSSPCLPVPASTLPTQTLQVLCPGVPGRAPSRRGSRQRQCSHTDHRSPRGWSHRGVNPVMFEAFR